jgi:hypothetical protein
MPLKKKVIRSLISAVPLGVTVASLTVNLTACSTSITLLTLLGNGQNGTIDTTIVTLTSDKPIIGLSNNDISFTNANVVVNSVTTDKNVYTINITGD